MLCAVCCIAAQVDVVVFVLYLVGFSDFEFSHCARRQMSDGQRLYLYFQK